MTKPTDNEQPEILEPISSNAFTQPEGWANINRTPYDEVSGVIYKRAVNIKCVRYTMMPTGTEPLCAEHTGKGEQDVRWVFSEQPGTEEGILASHTFRLLQDTELLPGAASQETAQSEQDTILYVLSGKGQLLHRPSPGSPNIVRPLRPFDAVLIRAKERFSIINTSETTPLRMIMLGLTPPEQAPR